MNQHIMNEFKEYIYLAAEMDAVYHEAARKAGISDSVMRILYTLAAFGDECTQSNVCYLTGISRQTINSAIRKLEREGIVYLGTDSRKNKPIRLTEKGKALAEEKVVPVLEAEKEMFSSWDEKERQELMRLTKKYLDQLKEQMRRI